MQAQCNQQCPLFPTYLQDPVFFIGDFKVFPHRLFEFVMLKIDLGEPILNFEMWICKSCEISVL